MPRMPDVIEGKCGCGNATWHEDWKEWRAGYELCQPESSDDTLCVDDDFVMMYLEKGYCPRCGYRLDPDGFARRMVQVTMQQARPLFGQLLAMLTSNYRDERTDEQLVYELNRLLPEEESDAN